MRFDIFNQIFGAGKSIFNNFCGNLTPCVWIVWQRVVRSPEKKKWIYPSSMELHFCAVFSRSRHLLMQVFISFWSYFENLVPHLRSFKYNANDETINNTVFNSCWINTCEKSCVLSEALNYQSIKKPTGKSNKIKQIVGMKRNQINSKSFETVSDDARH